MTIAAGSKILADDHRKIIKRARRTSSTGSTSGTTVLGVLRLDSVSMVSGRVYEIGTSGIGLDSTAGATTDVFLISVRINTSGAATISSSGVPSAWIRTSVQNITDGPIMPLRALYVPSGNVTASLLLTIQRTQGTTGTALMLGDPTFPIDLYVIDAGEDPGDTGVDI